MVNVGQDREESVGLQRENQFVNLERMRDRQHTPSVMVESCHIECTERSPSRTKSYVFHEQETQKLQLEIDHLRRKLRYRKRVRGSPSPPSSSGLRESRDCLYHHRSRTPSCKSFSMSSRQDKLEKDKYKCKKRSSHLDIGNNVMSKALLQISKSPFVRRINKARLPHRFSWPTFTVYNGRSDPVEHVSHFNQKMAIDSGNEALMC